MRNRIKEFLLSPAFGVVGASNNHQKYGNKVLRCYRQHNKKVYPINPIEETVEGLTCLHDVSELPNEVQSISIITPPNITEKIIDQAIQKKIKNVWMQPGAESELAIKKCKDNNINIIAEGPCLLVELGFID